MTSYLFVAMGEDGLEDPQTRNPIQINELKSHATRFAHAKIRQKRLNALKGNLARLPTTLAFSEPRQIKIPSKARGRLLQPRQTKAETETETEIERLNAHTPHPLTVLDLRGSNPFASSHMHDLPPILQSCLDYGYEVLWPTNCPALQGALLKTARNSWRRNGMESSLVFCAQVSNTATLCLAKSTDPVFMRNLSTLRVLYQNKAIALIQEALRDLVGPPSIALISCIMNIHGQGTQMFETRQNPVIPDSPIFKGFNLKLYGRFAPPRAHYPALIMLLKQRGGLVSLPPGVADPMQLADLCAANITLNSPTFPLLSHVAKAADTEKGIYDETATELLSTLGTGFFLRDHGVDHELGQLLSVACRLTAGIDEFQRQAPGSYPLSTLAVKSIALQHRILSLCAQSPVSLVLSAGNLEDFNFQIVRLTTLIFSDFVFFPTSEARNGRSLLAATLKDHLILGFEIYSTQISESTQFDHLILWALVLGGAASSSTSNREWYVLQIFERVAAQYLTWDGLQIILRKFLYYDYVLDQSTTNLWVEVFQSLQAEVRIDPGTLSIEYTDW